MSDAFKVSSDKSSIVSTTVEWLPMKTAPIGGKLHVLNLGKVATHTVLTESTRYDWLGWQGLPLIPDWMEEEIANRPLRKKK